MRKLVLAFSLFVAAISCGRVTSVDHAVVRGYIDSEPLIPTWSENVRPSVRAWGNVIKIDTNTMVTVQALEHIDQHVDLIYSGKNEILRIASPEYCLMVRDIRVSKDRTVLYFKASGLHAGIFPKTEIFRYDLVNKLLTHQLPVSPHILPPEKQPSTPAPFSMPK